MKGEELLEMIDRARKVFVATRLSPDNEIFVRANKSDLKKMIKNTMKSNPGCEFIEYAQEIYGNLYI